MSLGAVLLATLRLLACAALVAIAVHIAAILAAPRFSPGGAGAKLAQLAPEGQVVALTSATGEGTVDPLEDPAIRLAVCSFDLTSGPVKVSLPVDADDFASVSLHQEGGGAFFAVANSAAVNNRLEVIAMTPAQAGQRAAEDDDDNPSGEVRAVTSRVRGFAVFRALALFPSRREAAAATVARGVCQHLE